MREVELAETGSVGGFFALRTEQPEGGAHLPLAEVYAQRPPAALGARVDRVAARLGAAERRVGASVAQLGLTARLWSVCLGSAALHGSFPDITPDTLHWDGRHTSPDDLWWSGSAARPGTADELRAAVRDGHLAPLAEALRRDGAVSARLLWGNVGSALAGAVRELARWSQAQGRPEVARRAADLARELFAHPDLAGTVRGPALRRTSCCLYYRCPGGSLCGDCVFDRPPTRPAAPA
ncbi:hypothetical protein GCM10014713_01990 [Streptomyces purpureus]|uniref:Ferric iron reductase n=1 Tax=Streptomyces purpureus TaxID=1951 RepID=A0A918GX48_9ACTN|nr:hypothetical protein GCM10014713_01990 [Streptomyces purpureus]